MPHRNVRPAAVAAPMLRLSNSVVIAQIPAGHDRGGSRPYRRITWAPGRFRVSASVSPPVPWLVAAVGQSAVRFLREGVCDPIQLTFNTASLAAGNYSASVTVSDPNAIDSPQVVIVTRCKSETRRRSRRFLPPGSSTDVSLRPRRAHAVLDAHARGKATARPSRPQRLIAAHGSPFSRLEAERSRFTYYGDFRVHFAPPANMSPGTYSGNVRSQQPWRPWLQHPGHNARHHVADCRSTSIEIKSACSLHRTDRRSPIRFFPHFH